MPDKENYLMIDHRASPGIPEGYFRDRGFNMPEVGEGKLFETAVIVCAHCQRPHIKNPLRTRERASCQKCGGAYICDACEFASRQSGYLHTPFQKVIDLVRESGFRKENGYSQGSPNALDLPPLLKGK